MPTLILIAGPNGAGKTTFANEYLIGDRSRVAFVNADEIAMELARRGEVAASDLQAARLMLERLNALVDEGRDIVVESTLASRTYAISSPKWQDRRVSGWSCFMFAWQVSTWRLNAFVGA